MSTAEESERVICRPDIGVLLVALTMSVCAAAACAKTESPKNLIILTLDTTRADFLGAYSEVEPRRNDGIGAHTPALDALAARGTRFDVAISSSAMTPASHASILTGLDNHEHGLRVLSAEAGFRLPDDVPLLSEVLKANGYRTVAVHSAFPVSSVFGLGRDFDVLETLDTQLPDGTEGGLWDLDTFQRRSDETTALALGHMASTSQPFFLWVHYWDPHDRRKLPPPDYSARVSPKLSKGAATGPASRTRRQRLRYATEVAYMDSQIGALLDVLAQRGLLDDTLIVVVADHGQGLGDHDWLQHRILYQEQIRVPLLVAIPGVEQRPSVDALVRTKDIFPTVLDYLGIPARRPVSGRSLRPLIEGQTDAPRIAFANQINGFDLDGRIVAQRPLDDFVYVAMDRSWKLVYRPNHPDESELFDLATDPLESNDLYAATHPEAIRLMQALAESAPWVNEPYRAETANGDPEEMQRALEALGYVESGQTERRFTTPDWLWTCPDDPTISRANPDDRAGCSTPLIPTVSRAARDSR